MKKWYQSKTLWFNVLTLVVGVVGALLGVAKSQTAILVFTLISALGNGILRLFFTNTGIGKNA